MDIFFTKAYPIEIITSLEIIVEVENVLNRLKGAGLYLVAGFLDRFIDASELVEIPENLNLSLDIDDEDDIKFIECAVAGRCHYIISGDRHLLDIGEYGGINIMKVADFLNKLDVQ
jgi:putative PIN family toxin of toxin-antitoxin system